jgi:hypothetical protein
MRSSLRNASQALLVLLLSLALPTAASAATWTAHSLTNLSQVNSSSLYGISCFSASRCTAPGQGFFTNTGTNGAVAQTWNGSSWNPENGVAPNNGQKNGILWGVNCPSETMCMTVGSYGTSGGQVAWAQSQVGAVWTLWNIGVPAGATRSELNDVSCLTSSWCMGVGWKMVSGDDKPFATGFSGSSWTEASTVVQSNAALKGVSCVSTTYCVSVGSTGSKPLAEVWNGFAWSAPVAQPPVPGSWETAVLNGVLCLSTTWCMASGSLRRNESGVSYWRPFADIWNGSSWATTTGVPWGGNSEALAYGISCRSTTECWIVGEGHSGSILRPWAVKWTGSTWEIQSIALAPGAEGAQLRDISCYASSSCMAAGWNLFSGTKDPLSETVTP